MPFVAQSSEKNNCSSLYDSLLALRGWQRQEINGIEYELNSIITEKWEGKAYRLVIQRERRLDGEQDLWEGKYTYRCILTNDYTSTNREIVEFYNLRGGKERIFDDMNNGFGWARLPKSFMAENTVFLLLTALIHRAHQRASQVDKNGKALSAEYLHGQQIISEPFCIH